MDKEEWIVWKSDPPVSGLIELEHLEYGKNGLVLTFSKDEHVIQISFEHSVVSFRNTDEGKRLSTVKFLCENYSGDVLRETLFKVKNSNFVKWFHAENYDAYKDFNIEHYAFKTPNDIVEVLSAYPPKVTI